MDDILKLDTEEKRKLKDQAVEELEKEGLPITIDNIRERYLKLYEINYGKDV